MSSFDFIVDNIVFSYSSLSTYETCPYSFKMTYIDRLEREDNFFGQYGTLIHNTIHEYFAGNLDSFELSQYYIDNYYKVINYPPPSYPQGMEERYMAAGLEFFDNFHFNRNRYEIILNEEKLEFTFKNGTKFVAKPDLVLKERDTRKYILFDYKTAAPFRVNGGGRETVDRKKMDGYYRQMYIYTYAIRKLYRQHIEEITLWFTRPDRMVTIQWEEEQEKEAIKWLHGVVRKIKKDERFQYFNENVYFCNNLCSVRKFCEYRKSI